MINAELGMRNAELIYWERNNSEFRTPNSELKTEQLN